MLTESQRAAMTARLREGRPNIVSSIPRRPAGLAELPLTYGQEQLWFIDRFAPGLPAYNIMFGLRMSGPADTAAMSRAVDDLVERHEALRTRLLVNAEGRPVQVIDPPRAGTLEHLDFSGLEPDKREAALTEFLDTEVRRPFVLAKGPLLRTWLLRLADADHMLLNVVHHSVFDGWSMGVFCREVAALYRAKVTGEPAGLAEVRVQLADYALWERQRLQGPVLDELEAYWGKVMAGFETVQFPTDRPRPVLDSFEGGLARHRIDDELHLSLRELSRREGTTPFVVLMATLQVLLLRYTGQEDLVIGTTSANRARRELAPLIGYLVNTLPVRASLSGDPAFTEVLARAAEATTGTFAHQDLPFGRLVETLEVERDPGRAPVFQIAMTYLETEDAPLRAAGVDFTFHGNDLVSDFSAAKFDLDINIGVRSDGLYLEAFYKTGLFDAGTIQRLLGNWDVLLRGVVADPSVRLSRLPVLTDAELRRELMEWSDTAAVVPQGCVHERFEAQVTRTPGAVAAEYEGRRWSYAELNGRANQIARRLRELRVGPETLVGVGMLAGLDRLAGMLGIWKAGGGYVPLDPELPADRLSFMIADTGMSVVLTEERSAGRMPTVDGVRVLSLDGERERERVGALDGSDLAGTGVEPPNLAYVIYTSGSTGQPKGVMVEHRQAVNFLHGMAEHWQLSTSDMVLQFSAFTFDVSVLDTFAGLVAGAKVVLAPTETLHSPPRLAALIRDARITFAAIPPAVLSLLAGRELPGLRVLITAGEELPSEVARSFTLDGLRFVNGYGPTEATVLATYQELDGSAYPPPIGLPTWPNYQAYVLDRHLNPVPGGVIGELHIGGAGVARGYLNRPQLTALRFIADPFAATPGARLYKTGDLVRRRPDGSIVFVGRVDDQVKIRGLRVELGEVETALAAHPGVAQAVVTVVTDPAGDRQLAGYLRPARGAEPAPAELRSHLADSLPDYMIPAYLVTVAQLPLNASGKVDRAALPPPQVQSPSVAREAPATLVETMVADMFANLLGLDQVGATDSFFDVGGSSLQAMRLIGVMAEELQVDIGVAEVFLAPTPRQLAALLRDEHGLDDAPLDDAALEDTESAGMSSE